MATHWRWRNIPVPESYVVGFAVAIVLHRARRWHLVKARPGRRWLGWPLIVGGAGLVVASVRAAGDIELGHTERLVTTGPYAHSRNPMYTGWALASTGIGLVAGSGWLLAAIPAAAWWVHCQVLSEEQRLAATFGDAFNEYRDNVSRYWSLSKRASTTR